MQANPRSLDALFNSQLRYVVPMFQRHYVWQEMPQWTTLWEDVAEKAKLQLENRTSNAHYLGALIIEGVRPQSPREVKRFLIIDGQQRLTTLQLMLCAYRDVARLNEWKTLDRTTSRYLENSDIDVMEFPDEERFKVWPTALNRVVFKDIVSAGSKADVEARYPLIRRPRKRQPEPRPNLVEAYLFFARKLTEWITDISSATGRTMEDCAFNLLQALQQDFSVVEISLSEGDDSQEIFYSLNSQGRALSQSDLLRSLIFMRAEKEKVDRDVLFADYWGQFETAFWSAETKRGGRTYSRLDLALRFFLMAKTGDLVDARRVNEEYRRWVSASPPKYANVAHELADFSRHAVAYRRYAEGGGQPLPSTDLVRVLADLDVSTALPLVLHLELDAGLDSVQLSECFAIVESFVCRRGVTGEETKEYNKLFVEVVGAIRDVPPDGVRKALANKLLSGGGATRQWPTDEQLIEAVISRPVSLYLRTPALRLILERLEVEQRTKKSEQVDIAANLQVEHVLPQAWAAHWPLNGVSIPAEMVSAPYLAVGSFAPLADSIRARNNRLHTVGNLTLLNGYLNPAASNAEYTTKLREYKHSVLRLNRYFESQDAWDEAAIEKRGRTLARALCAIWRRPSA